MSCASYRLACTKVRGQRVCWHIGCSSDIHSSWLYFVKSQDFCEASFLGWSFSLVEFWWDYKLTWNRQDTTKFCWWHWHNSRHPIFVRVASSQGAKSGTAPKQDRWPPPKNRENPRTSWTPRKCLDKWVCHIQIVPVGFFANTEYSRIYSSCRSILSSFARWPWFLALAKWSKKESKVFKTDRRDFTVNRLPTSACQVGSSQSLFPSGPWEPSSYQCLSRKT